MIYNEGLLSDGQPVKVRQLALWELEDNGVPIPPNLRYRIQGGDGNEYEQEYDLDARLQSPPSPPGGDATEWDIIEWQRFQAALLRRQEQKEAERQDKAAKAAYILQNCLAEEDRLRVVTPADFDEIYRLALCPEVRMEDIQAELASFFPGRVEWLSFIGRLKERQGQWGQLPGHAEVGSQAVAGEPVEPGRILEAAGTDQGALRLRDADGRLAGSAGDGPGEQEG